MVACLYPFPFSFSFSFSFSPRISASITPYPHPLPLPKKREIENQKKTKKKPTLSSLTSPSSASLMSRRTSSSQFSFRLSAALVCCRKRCRSPHFTREMCGCSEDSMWGVMRCEPRARPGRRSGCCVYVVAILGGGGFK